MIVDASPRPWADLVFHVLAHVRPAVPMAASLYDRTYAKHVAQVVGTADERTLGDDAAALARVLTTHDQMAGAQLLAWAFETPEQAMRDADVDLAELPWGSGGWMGDLSVALELLRCAALLEWPAWTRLPEVEPPCDQVREAMERVSRAAPVVHEVSIAFVRALRLRGRVRAGEVWVGVPQEALDVSVAHVSWQAAHEATVLEVARAARAEGQVLTHAELEGAALRLMRQRARTLGMQRAHGEWLAHLGAVTHGWLRQAEAGVAARLVDACLRATS